MKGIIFFGAIAIVFALAAGDPVNNEETEAEEADRKMAAILPVRTSWSHAEALGSGDVFATINIDRLKPGDEDQKIMDTDIKRSGMNETNKFLSMSMMRASSQEAKQCKDLIDSKKCKKIKEKGKCGSKKAEKDCKKTCDLCQDDCQDTLENLHCLSECPTPGTTQGNASNYHHILGRCYYFEGTPMNFTEAMENCETIFGTKKRNRGRLFESRNSKVNDAVARKGKTIANNLEGSQWIGIRTDSNITTNSTERNFFYLSGGPFTRLPYAKWFDSGSDREPNNSDGDEKCVQIYTRIDGTWNDILCSKYFQSICEMGLEVIW